MSNGRAKVVPAFPRSREGSREGAGTARAVGNGRSSASFAEPAPALFLLDSKLEPPTLTSRSVPRRALLGRLRATRGTPIVAMTAPSGFGKTTLAAQWAAKDRRGFGWLSIDERDEDPEVFLRYLAAALAPHCPVEPDGAGAHRRNGGHVPTVPAIASSVQRAHAPFVLVVDDAHLLRDPACAEALVAIADNLPRDSQLLLSGREEVGLPMAALRAEGRVAEIGGTDLAMTAEEAGSLLRRMDLDCSKREVVALAELTEGWPAALHLAGRSLQEDRFDRASTMGHIRQSQSVVDYLRSEFLSELPRGMASFLTRTSVLREMSAPLCDATLGRTGSARVLADLARRNMLLVPLDQHGERFRYHPMLRQLLRSDLDRQEPERARELLLRAAAWCEEQGSITEALEYASDLGDHDLLARLLHEHALDLLRRGHAKLLGGWFDWFEERDLLVRYPAIAALGAVLQLLMGRNATLQRWAEAAERGAAGLRAEERRPVQGILAIVHAATCRTGPRQMEADAERAMRLLPAGAGWRPVALLLQAVARRMQGGGEDTDPLFVTTFEEAIDQHAYPTATVALAERAILAIEQDDWLAARDLVDGALRIVETVGLEAYATTALVTAVAARVALHEGDLAIGRERLTRAHRLRGVATHALPYLAVQVRLELARAYMTLTDSAGARTMLRELESLFALRRDLGVFRQQVDEVHALASSMRATFVGGSSLTTAELRLLPLLATHFSFREIAERLFVSRHTVKTQAISIYRKLRVTSRSEAVESARRTGLLAA